jgi:hypothetical protein
MTTDIYTPEDRLLLQAWLDNADTSEDIEEILVNRGFDRESCHYTRLDAAVGSIVVQDIQTRLPNCGVGRSDGSYTTTRKIRPKSRRQVTQLPRHLFTMNWADSAPGLSWPAAYHLCWLPGFDRFVLAYSADSPDVFGYCDFALGYFGPDADWRESVKEILIEDWRTQWNEWDQTPWAYVLVAGTVSEAEALAWRNKAWRGHEYIDGDAGDCDENDEDADVPAPAPTSLTLPDPMT